MTAQAQTEILRDPGEEPSSYPKKFLEDDTSFFSSLILGTSHPYEAQGRAEHRTSPSVLRNCRRLHDYLFWRHAEERQRAWPLLLPSKLCGELLTTRSLG